MHVAEFNLFNSYIPLEYRKIIKDYYVIDKGTNDFFPTGSFTNQFDDPSVSDTKFNLKFNYLVNDDINISISNQYGNITNMVGLGFLNNVNSLNKNAAKVIKKDNTVVQNLNSLLNYSIWQKTEPLSTNLTIILYAKTDPLIDVVIPAYVLMSHCIIDYSPENRLSGLGDIYSFPGLSAFEAINISSVKDGVRINSERATSDFNFDGKFTSKLMSLYIQGVIAIDLAMIKNITPVFSKHTAKSNYDQGKYKGNYPISAELTLQIESITPADSSMLWEGSLITMRQKRKNVSYINSRTNATTSSSPPAQEPKSPPENPTKPPEKQSPTKPKKTSKK